MGSISKGLKSSKAIKYLSEAVDFTLRAHNDNWGIEQIAFWLKEHSAKLD